MASEPLAYLITFTCYGTWLHGREPGSVDAEHNQVGTPFLPADPSRERQERRELRDPPYVLDAARRDIVLRTIGEVAAHRRWVLLAAHVRSNHVHVVVQAPVRPEKVMADFKAYASRRLREATGELAERKRWTEHGSTRYLWQPEQVWAAIRYVIAEQGEPMSVYVAPEYSSALLSEPEA